MRRPKKRESQSRIRQQGCDSISSRSLGRWRKVALEVGDALGEIAKGSGEVKELVGHSAIQTTLRHYNEVSEDDKRKAVEKLRKHQGAG